MSIFISEEELKKRKCVGIPSQKHRWKWWDGGVIKECIKCGVKVLKTMSDKTYKSKMKTYWAEKNSIWRK